LEDKIEKGLLKAYETAYRILQPIVENPLSSFSFIIKVEYDENGPIRLVMEVELSRKHARELEELLGEALNAAARAF
jgi:hypothetical protein